MKHLILLIFIFPSFAFAQKKDAFRIDSIPLEGLLLNKEWKWHSGDNPDWAKIDFDDSKWEGIDPTRVIPELPPNISNQPLWLRLKFNNSINRNCLILSLKQSGATEIFLNNYKIQSFGTIDTLNKENKSYDPNGDFITLPLDTAENNLAIKYYFEKGLRYKSVFDTRFPLFSARVFSASNAIESDKNKSAFIWEGVNIGVPLILFVVHFILFLFYTPIRANLWYSLWALCSAIGAYILLQIKLEHHIEFKNDYALYAAIVSGLGNLSLEYSLLLLLRQHVIKWLIAFLILTIISFIAFLSESYLSFAFSLLAAILISLFTLYMGYTAFKQGNIGGKYVIYTMLLYIIIWTLFIFSFDIFKMTWISDVLFHIALFCLPIMVSILLGLDTRNIHTHLVKVTLEKQQLLENQNQVLEKEVTERTAALNQTLLNLQSTQSQLIQSEKMASLGELTAGIAHEIQNPLNFVNNFSEVNNELIKEIKQELTIGNDRLTNGELQTSIGNLKNAIELSNDIESNSKKINHHGQRASSIVKGMLEHSRTSSGIKEPADINKLCDEFVRLSYQGLRAKDKEFNCEYKLDLDPNMPLVNVVSQDIGRVILNVINNAFQACDEKRRKGPAASGEEGSQLDYKPVVTVNTKYVAPLRRCEIFISDNGPGIPDKIKDKIFQPFFTTKPTGQGTGLGLSLAYDIVKAHEGNITCNSILNNGATFTITIPI